LIDKPPVDSFVEMRRLDAEQKKTQENSQPKDQPHDPISFCKAGFPSSQVILRRWKIC